MQEWNTWLAFVSTLLNLWFPYNARNFLTSCGTVSFLRRTMLHGISYLVSLVS